MYMASILIYNDVHALQIVHMQARIQKLFKWGVEEENFERKMFVDTRIKAYTHKH